MKAEAGKFYLLDNDAMYFCVDIQRKVKFADDVIVECTNNFGDAGHFGKLVDAGYTAGPDYVTNTEIEFGDDNVIKEYELKSMPFDIFVFDVFKK